MNAYYKPLFSVQCFHDYYTDEICPDLQIEPTAQCAALLAGYRMLFKGSKNGGVVISQHKKNGTEAEPVITPEKGMVFTFKVIMKNPLFLNITDTNQKDIGSRSVFVFTNAPTGQGNIPHVEVHKGALSNPLDTVGPVFTYPVPHSKSPTAISLHDETGGRINFTPLVTTMNTVTFDLQGAPEGIYEVRSLNGSGVPVKTERFFVSDAYLTPQLLGYLQVRFHQSIITHIQTLHTFILSFKNRSIKWKYKLTVEKAADEDETSESEEIKLENLKLFNTPANFKNTPIITPPGEPGKVNFLSQVPIALREQPYPGITLKLLPDGGGDPPEPMVLIKNMPNPETHRLVQDEPGNLISEMHLKIKLK